MELPRKRNPLLIIYDLPSKKTNEKITETLFHQNLEETMNFEEFNQKFKTGPRDRDTVHHVAEVSPDLRKLLLNRNRVYHAFTSHNIRDYIVVPRCLKCEHLGHVKKYCKQEKTVCMHCGEQDHVKSECQKRQQPATCIPCAKRNKRCSPDGRDCLSYKIMWERHVAMIDYG